MAADIVPLKDARERRLALEAKADHEAFVADCLDELAEVLRQYRARLTGRLDIDGQVIKIGHGG